RQCQQMFPAAFPSPPTVQTPRTNSLYRGWNVTISNLFFATGQRDPWRYSTLSAPSVTTQSTAVQPIAESEGCHCADLRAHSRGLPTPSLCPNHTR
ncbi:hypothetical protein B0H17DRAFT_938032, partial [Mycena rosella]